jgi:predicted RNA-binding Zn-ribbon protein involved in translation (DUF1610 family)
MPEGSGATRLIAIDAAVQCTRCLATIQVAGPVLHVRCHQCGQEIAIPQLLWLQTLLEVDERSFDAGTLRTSAGACRREQANVHLAIEWSRSEPSCRRCGASVPEIEAGLAGEVGCPSCGASLPTFPAPPWLRAEVPTALQVYGVEYVFDAAALDPTARRWWLTFQGTPPRKAQAKRIWIEQEIVSLSQRSPQQREGMGYAVPLLLACVVIALAAYYILSALSASGGSDLL